MHQRYPDWDPRSWSEPYHDPPTRPEVKRVPGQWIERPDGTWDWAEPAPAAADQLDTDHVTPSAPEYEIADQSVTLADDDVHLPQSMAGLDGTQLAVCPTCGTGVAASRLKQRD